MLKLFPDSFWKVLVTKQLVIWMNFKVNFILFEDANVILIRHLRQHLSSIDSCEMIDFFFSLNFIVTEPAITTFHHQLAEHSL